ncbi:MAG: hypothetical protein CMF46_04125 [Legionellales bacterium]|nr:hypothetical protein [Legionellales bacterium]|tara:strand:+ start:1323 stop:1562 length:240 start_codon:yes stop_codon:yes gene_type:complete
MPPFCSAARLSEIIPEIIPKAVETIADITRGIVAGLATPVTTAPPNMSIKKYIVNAIDANAAAAPLKFLPSYSLFLFYP